MNIFMEKLVLIDLDGRQYKFDDFFVHRRYIKYIEIPHNVSIICCDYGAVNMMTLSLIEYWNTDGPTVDHSVSRLSVKY